MLAAQAVLTPPGGNSDEPSPGRLVLTGEASGEPLPSSSSVRVAAARLVPRAPSSAPGNGSHGGSPDHTEKQQHGASPDAAAPLARRASCGDDTRRSLASSPPVRHHHTPYGSTCSSCCWHRSRARRPGEDETSALNANQCLTIALPPSPPCHQRSPREPVEARSGGSVASLSQAVSSALAGIAAEARRDEILAERVALWKDRLRERGA